MRRLPLFPLPVVLLPGTTMPLHIFEPRYRQMVARCLEYDRRFGLIYHDPDRMGPFAMEERRVGTVARIGEFQVLPDGRSLLVAHGESRFRIVDGIESRTPYFEGLVESFEDEPGVDPEELIYRRRRSLNLLMALAVRLREEDEEGVDPLPPLDPAQEVSFRVARAIQLDPLWLQQLLELPDERVRLRRLDRVLSQALEELQEG